MRPARKHTLAAVAAALAGLFVAGCGGGPPMAPGAGPTAERPATDTGSLGGLSPDPSEGRALFLARGCVACHRVEGIPEATGAYGPPLTGIAGRETIAGVAPNTPETMKAWLLDPAALKPDAAMPQPGLTEREAEHLAAFLATLR